MLTFRSFILHHYHYPQPSQKPHVNNYRRVDPYCNSRIEKYTKWVSGFFLLVKKLFNLVNRPTGSCKFCEINSFINSLHLYNKLTCCLLQQNGSSCLMGNLFSKHIKVIFFMSTIDKIILVSLALHKRQTLIVSKMKTNSVTT